MIITIHQPEHLPWLGFFNKMSKADVFVLLDSVQFKKNNFQNRNRILGTKGAQWIGIPASKEGRMEGTIATTRIAADKKPKWKEHYLQTIKGFYNRYPYFNDVYPLLQEAMNIETEYFCDINIRIIESFADALGYTTQFVKSSEMDVNGQKTELLLDICQKLNADVYISGPDGRNYMELDLFENAGIEVRYNDYVHPTYPQCRSEEFVPYLSAIDLFMNCGFDEARRIINEGNEGTNTYDYIQQTHHDEK